MKRFRWWILGFLLLGGVVLALVSRPERESLELTFVVRTNDAAGHPRVVVRVTNHSRDEFTLLARSEGLVGTEWRFLFPEFGSGRRIGWEGKVRPGGAWQTELPAPMTKTQWRVRVAGVREISRLEGWVLWCFDKLRLKYPRDPYVEKFLEFSE